MYDHRVVPDDPAENAAWRTRTLELCETSERLRREVLERCRADFWYWAKGFAFVHEPRVMQDGDLSELSTQVPFLPWPHQVPVVDRILAVLGKRDLRIVKSRAQGASWLVILIFLWRWLFTKGFRGNFVSKDEDSVDRRNDMSALMPKCDWLLSKLPEWMVGVSRKDWKRTHTGHTLVREDGETAITGYACTGDVASGGRATAFVLDEHAKHPRGWDKVALAATQPISPCRIFISTPKGMDGAFYEIVHDASLDEPLLKLDWRDNPTQNRGLYRVVEGNPVPIDVEKFGSLPQAYRDPKAWKKLRRRLEERGYDLITGPYRSPWYDTECLRPGADPVLIAQEYDMDFGSSVARYFSDALVNRLKHNSVRLPMLGEFHVNSDSLTGHWTEHEQGRFRRWFQLDANKRPPPGDYIIACDVASGVGGDISSNSTITAFNRRSGEKVLAFASPSTLPYDLAELAIALCRWFTDGHERPAFLIWESNYGGEFRIRVERSDFQYYYRRKGHDRSIYARDTGIAGYHTQRRSALLGPYREALLEGYFNNPDGDAVEELRQYAMGADGEPVHVGSRRPKGRNDSSGAGLAHGDRVIADALAWHASMTFGDQHAGKEGGERLNVNNVREDNVPVNSAAWRRARYLEAMRKQPTKSRW